MQAVADPVFIDEVELVIRVPPFDDFLDGDFLFHLPGSIMADANIGTSNGHDVFFLSELLRFNESRTAGIPGVL